MTHDATVIGTGFGGAIAATQMAKRQKKVLLLERGTWWITPERLGKQPPGKTIPEFAKENHQPVQYWPRLRHKDAIYTLG